MMLVAGEGPDEDVRAPGIELGVAARGRSRATTAARSGISIGREGPVAPIPEPVLPFRD